MASANKASDLSEAEYGCGKTYRYSASTRSLTFRLEHLGHFLNGDEKTAGRFYESFLRADVELSLNLRGRDHDRKANCLKPVFSCLHCVEICDSNTRQGHAQKTRHQFCMAPYRHLRG